MKSLFARKPISELLIEGDHPNSLKRELGAGDLIMLAIGAVIGAGIFGAIGTAAAGQLGPNGEVIRPDADEPSKKYRLNTKVTDALSCCPDSAASGRGSANSP